MRAYAEGLSVVYARGMSSWHVASIPLGALAALLAFAPSATAEAQGIASGPSMELLDPFPSTPSSATMIGRVDELLDPFADLPIVAVRRIPTRGIIDPFVEGARAASELLDPWAT